MNNLTILLIGIVLTWSSASAETIVQLGTQYPNHTIKEGYAGDIEQLPSDELAARTDSGGKSLLITMSADTDTRHPGYSGDIIISDVRSSVYSDDDHDGFYTHFSLTFDVDTYHGYEYVYAKIYLSKDGTHYKLFHITDVFEIYSDYSSDRYKVDSKLVSNFDAAYYDVKIEIFSTGSTSPQDEVDASTHRALFALPLEADRLDGDSNADIIVHEHAGAFSTPSLLTLALFGLAGLLLRRKTS